MEPRWEAPQMRRFSESLLRAAREEAVKMIQSGEEMKALDLGEQGNAIFISTNPEKILGSEKFEVEGKTIYIGLPVETGRE